MKIPIPYQVILRRFFDKSYDRKIHISEARKILTFHCGIPKNLSINSLNEMERNKWIKFENFQTIKLLIKINGQKYYDKKERAILFKDLEIEDIKD